MGLNFGPYRLPIPDLTKSNGHLAEISKHRHALLGPNSSGNSVLLRQFKSGLEAPPLIGARVSIVAKGLVAP